MGKKLHNFMFNSILGWDLTEIELNQGMDW